MGDVNNTDKLEKAQLSLLGLSIGDAFGETFFGKEESIRERIDNRIIQEEGWLFTDDTVMGIGVYNILLGLGEVNQDKLARQFADNYLLDDYRGYGGTAHSILKAIAVALAACFCAGTTAPGTEEFFDFIIKHTPDSDVRSRINKAATIPKTYDIRTVTSILGNGVKLTAQDTVPFALWCAAHNLNDYSEALWLAVSGLGDRDTICAIVGSVVILCAPKATLPILWVNKTEKWELSPFFRPLLHN